MEAHHASLGRRKLEEIRQKRAAERPNSSSLGNSSSYGQLSDLEKIKDMEAENRKLFEKLELKENELDNLQKRLSNLEHGELPSLRKAVNDLSVEKDAAATAREDALAQLRVVKKRLKEAEEEQFRAEEDAASLRAEMNLLQHQLEDQKSSVTSSITDSREHIHAMEEEVARLKTALQQESMLRQQEQKKLAEEQMTVITLTTGKKELEEQLATLSQKFSEDASKKIFSKEEKEKLENQMHELAVMVERLESGRQKLLMEIDSQSSEIERLFEENSDLTASYHNAMNVAVQWENQVKDCLKQNEELRKTLDNLRSEQVQAIHLTNTGSVKDPQGVGVSSSGSQPVDEDNALLKAELAKERTRAEALAAEVLQLTSELKRAVQAYNGVTSLYKPILWNIENSLMKMKQDSFTTI